MDASDTYLAKGNGTIPALCTGINILLARRKDL
jgi:hypothetical protein